MTTKYRSTQKIRRSRILTSVEDDGRRLAAYQTSYGIVIAYRHSGTVIQFIHSGVSYRIRYLELLPDSMMEEIALRWVDEIVKAQP